MPNLATSRAILWRRLATLRRRFARPAQPAPAQPDQVPPAPASPAADPPSATVAAEHPAPLLVDYFGRDGSTAMLRLLSTSPDVFVPGRYPYEHRDVGKALGTPDPAAAWGRFCAARFGPRGPVPDWYAEKMIDVRKADVGAFSGSRCVVMLRDPRDTWVSIEAFSRAVGAREIGGAGTLDERLDRFVERQRERLAWIAALEGEGARVVRYEELVEDPVAVAGTLSGWLGIDLDPAGIAGDFRLRWVHGTSPDPHRSVGRWRRELPEPELTRIRAGLGDAMATAGFGD